MTLQDVTTKVCTKCGKYKVLDDFYSWLDKRTNKVKYQAWCKTCTKHHRDDVKAGIVSKQHPRSATSRERSGVSQQCHSCNEYKDANEFIVGRFRDQSICSDCRDQGHLCTRDFCDFHRIG